MEILKKVFKKGPRNLWKPSNYRYQEHASHFHVDSTAKEERSKYDDRVVYIEDMKKRKDVYGICGECNEPGTGEYWCRPCNAKRLKDNFENWTSGNKDIDELIQQSQLNAVHNTKCLHWIPFENFQNVTYITSGGFGKIYSARWPEGRIILWDIEYQEWIRVKDVKVALKSLHDSSDISTELLNEIKSHLHIYVWDVMRCYGLTQDPNTKDYVMILPYCKDGNLRNYLNTNYINYQSKIVHLFEIARGLLNIHDAGKVHKDLHSGNILFSNKHTFISDLGMCQPANNENQSEGVYGVLPYMAPEVLRGHQYTKAADIYSFGIIMNELMSEEIPYHDIPHDYDLTIKICKGLRPKISKDIPKLLVDLIIKCWDELSQILRKWKFEIRVLNIINNARNPCNKYSEIYSQIEECEKIRENKIKNNQSENKPKNTQTHPQAIYTSRLLNFENLPEQVNSTELIFYHSDVIQSINFGMY